MRTVTPRRPIGVHTTGRVSKRNGPPLEAAGRSELRVGLEPTTLGGRPARHRGAESRASSSCSLAAPPCRTLARYVGERVKSIRGEESGRPAEARYARVAKNLVATLRVRLQELRPHDRRLLGGPNVVGPAEKVTHVQNEGVKVRSLRRGRSPRFEWGRK